jgi:hypothetical protein
MRDMCESIRERERERERAEKMRGGMYIPDLAGRDPDDDVVRAKL